MRARGVLHIEARVNDNVELTDILTVSHPTACKVFHIVPILTAS